VKVTAHLRAAFLCAIAALLISTALSAQQYTFRQYGPSDGLTNLAVNCLLQDRIGYLWVGTDNGLFRYDGSRFQEFGHAEGLDNAEIHGLAESPDGVLWVAMQGGVARRAGGRFETVDVGEKGLFQGVAFDNRGRIYLEHSSGIIRGLNDGAGNYRFSMLAPGTVSGLFIKGEDVWFARDRDLWRLRADKAERIGSPAGLPADLWDAITQDTLGNLWARSAARLYELPSGQNRFVDRSDGIPHASLSHLYADLHGRVFVSTNAGVVMLDAANGSNAPDRTYIDAQHGLPADVAGPVLKDRDESLWLGMVGGGLVRRLGHGEWFSWKKQDGLLNNSVWAILHDRAGLLWVGTSGGLSIFGPDGALAHSYTTRDGLVGDRVFSIVASPGGDVFVGTDPAGISRFSEKGVLLRTYGPASGLAVQQVNAIAFDHQNRMWAVGPGGSFRSRAPIDTAELKFDPVDIPGIPSHAYSHHVEVDPSGTVWISTPAGLARFDGNRWRVFTKSDGLKSSDLSGIAQRQGELWVAYRDALGIARLRFQGEHVEVTNFTEHDGLSSDLIYALAFDHAGRLWASTDNGVSVLVPGAGGQSHQGHQGHWRRYGMEDGLIWDDGNDHALSVDHEGNVWIGTSEGLSRYTSPRYPIPDSPPAVVLTSIQGASQEYQAEDQPVLTHAQNSLLIRFSGLNYASESRTRFRYRLLDHKTDWNETREGSVHFENLSSGHYVFEVIAAGPNGLWSPVPARFAFSVRPAWWQSWWFLSACLLVALLLGRAFWRFRVRVLVIQKELLERQVADRTEELRESHRQLEKIAYYDMLTSLPNRRIFTEQFRARLALARRHGEPLALLLVDLDRFKQTNDTFGHDAGDAVLIETAVRLRAAVRESDCVARLGGDEFGILLITAAAPAGIDLVCRRIVDSFIDGISFNSVTLKTSCSVGAALLPQHGDTQEHLYKSADLALYEAKRSGRNTFCIYRPELTNASVQLSAESGD
jgi:diguanylate cyclase (GGDEF)-like protein